MSNSYQHLTTDQLHELYSTHCQNLALLEKQKASLGNSLVPISITNQIQEIRNEIVLIEQQLEERGDSTRENRDKNQKDLDLSKASAPILRQFLYIDQEVVDQYISSISREYNHSHLDSIQKFNKLYSHVERYDLLENIDNMDMNRFSSIKDEFFFEFHVKSHIAKLITMSKFANGLIGTVNMIEKYTGDNIIQKDKKYIDAINDMAKNLIDDKGVPLIMNFLNERRFQILSYLDPSKIFGSVHNLNGKLKIFCRVQIILKEKQTIEIFDFVEMQKMFATNRAERRRATHKPAPQEVYEVIKYPGLLVIPIAVYR